MSDIERIEADLKSISDARRCKVSKPDDEIDVWIVKPSKSGLQARVVFDDREAAIEYAGEVLAFLFDGLGDCDCDMLVVERGKMERSVYNKLEDV